MRVTRRDRALALIVVPDLDGTSWLVTALESPNDHEPTPPIASLQRAFNDHAHEVLGARPSPGEAFALAEKYAKWWQRSGAQHGACDCETIAKPKKRAAALR